MGAGGRFLARYEQFHVESVAARSDDPLANRPSRADLHAAGRDGFGSLLLRLEPSQSVGALLRLCQRSCRR